MRLATFGLLLVGQTLAVIGLPALRVKRDAPLLPSWDVPTLGFEPRSETFISYSEPLHDEYGVPHEEYGVPHEEYGPPAVARVAEPVTPHYCPEEDIVAPFVRAPPAPEFLPLPETFVPVAREEKPYPAPHEEYGPPELPVFRPPPAPEVLPLPLPFVPEVREEKPYPAPHEEYGPPELPHEEYGVPTTSAPLPPAPYPAPTTRPPPTLPPTTRPPTTLPPTTRPPTTLPPTTREAPYPAPYPERSVPSHYGEDSGGSTGDTALGGFAEEPVIVPAVRAPSHSISYVKPSHSISYVKPKFIFTKKFVALPKLGFIKKKIIGFGF